MKDIKTLYLTAKSSGKQADINSYTEAIQELINEDPNSYITHLEYIISSDIGLNTLKPFIEKNGFSIACYDNIIECLNECIRKCGVYNKDSSLYTEMVNYFESFREKNLGCFMMFENYKLDLDKDYIKTYYGKNKNGHQNRKLAAGMIDKFGEAAIPDVLLTAESIDESAVKTVLEFISNKYNENCSTLYEWLLTACENISYNESCNELIKHFEENSLTSIVNKIKNKEHQLFRESVILDKPDLMMEYSEDDINAIQELIMFKEYKITWKESFNELQNEIYSLYEMLDGLIEEDVADSIIPMLPNDSNMKESLSVVNTRNKKTGAIPGYISKNHDLSYGEEDPTDKNNNTNSSSDEHNIEDYRRPSADNDSNNTIDNNPINFPSAFNNKNDNENEDDNKDKNKSSSNISEDDKKIINNYYYTYTNSLNRNSNSYNKDNSTRNSNSYNRDNSKRDNHTVHKNDYSKTINNYDSEYSLISDEKPEDKNESILLKKWELNIFDNYDVINEAKDDISLDRPKSDHPIKDIFMDIDRETTKKQQEAKKKVQDLKNVGRAMMKPVNRTKSWISRMVHDWKDADENNIKEKMADPRTRNNLYSAIKKAIIGGSLLKAGILFNPLFLFLSVSRLAGKDKRIFRIRNEMIGEIKAELAIIDEKIRDANDKHDNAEKYKLMRLKNELNKKLIRVGGTKEMSKMI